MTLPESIATYARSALERLVRIPSVSAEGRALPEAAALVAELLEGIGARTEIHATAGAPVVFGEKPAEPGYPTVLFYNHYDVQPADPLDEWLSEPFEMVERDGAWYGRGVSDDKSEFVSRLAGLKWYLHEHGSVPFGFKFVVEGEEEIGSPNLARYVADNANRLAADGCVWEFGGVTSSGAPMTYFGLKGIVCLELRVRTAGHDLHSSLGAVVENPIYRLARVVTSLRDDHGRVLVEGFYDDVEPLSDAVRELLGALPDEAAELARVYGVPGYIGGVTGSEFQRVRLTEPNVNFNGFTSGYGGPGSKTVLPAVAGAKLDLRLVPNQDPARIVEALRAHLDRNGFEDVELIPLETSEFAARSDVSHPFVRATLTTLREVYGMEPVAYPNSAGSGPMHPFLEHLGLPVVGLGTGHPGSRAHSPNENVRHADFELGVASVKRLCENFCGLPG